MIIFIIRGVDVGNWSKGSSLVSSVLLLVITLCHSWWCWLPLAGLVIIVTLHRFILIIVANSPRTEIFHTKISRLASSEVHLLTCVIDGRQFIARCCLSFSSLFFFAYDVECGSFVLSHELRPPLLIAAPTIDTILLFSFVCWLPSKLPEAVSLLESISTV